MNNTKKSFKVIPSDVSQKGRKQNLACQQLVFYWIPLQMAITRKN